MNMTPVKELDFEIDVENGKYTIRVFKGNGGIDFLRHSEPWISDTTGIPGINMWIDLIFEVHAWRTGQGSASAQMPREFAEKIVTAAKLPKDIDGREPLPIPREKLVELIALAVTRDRERGPLDARAIAETVLKPGDDGRRLPLSVEEFRQRAKTLIISALITAQARGARIEKKTINEDDYAEASRAGHEAFMSCLKDKGLV